MGKPRLIILIRHAQSEGNKNREIHQMIPDHRVKLTDEGWRQAEEAGYRLRQLLKPDDTLQIYTSPYRRTRETTEGILKTLTARSDPSDPTAAPSPFGRSKIKVYEEPRIREQDFGNFQPESGEMERMWKERANYGHFFYRIPNGESAADAYDRISGFNESLWRQFGEADFPSVCVLVTHGLMTRVFLMKWYHWSVEYFEDLRNINHCEFIIMKQRTDSGKYVLENQLRTWSDLKRQRALERAEEEARNNPSRRNTLSAFLTETQGSPGIPPRKWAGHEERHQGREQQQQSQESKLPPPAKSHINENDKARRATGGQAGDIKERAEKTADGSHRSSKSTEELQFTLPLRSTPSYLRSGHSASGTDTPHEMPSDDEGEYFETANPPAPPPRNMAAALQKAPQRKATQEDIERWASESGMGEGKQADALGDEPAPDEVAPDELAEEEAQDKSVRGSVY